MTVHFVLKHFFFTQRMSSKKRGREAEDFLSNLTKKVRKEDSQTGFKSAGGQNKGEVQLGGAKKVDCKDFSMYISK